MIIVVRQGSLGEVAITPVQHAKPVDPAGRRRLEVRHKDSACELAGLAGTVMVIVTFSTSVSPDVNAIT